MDENETVSVWRSKPFLFVIGFLALAFATIAVANASDSTVIENTVQEFSLQDASKSVYRLYMGQRQECSAVAVSPTQLVTAAHCVPQFRGDYSIRTFRLNNNLEVTSFTNHSVSRVRYNENDDTAFLELKDDSLLLNPVSICRTDEILELGTEMWALGYPFVDKLTLTSGMFTSISALPPLEGGKFYQTTVPVEGGSSGGGLFIKDDNGYCLVGVTTAHRIGRGFFPSYFSTLEAVKNVTRGLIR